jgi:ribosomal protein S12 methylthiotransferase
MKKVHITSLGCPKNTVDSEVLGGQLQDRGYTLLPDPELADIIIINTCGFIQEAKEESIQAIFEALELKNKDKDKKIFVIGCLTQRYRKEITKEIPAIDGIFGVEDYKNILEKLVENNFSHSDAFAEPESLYKKRIISKPCHSAYIKISEGCNRSCSFCIIPSIKGCYRSRSIDSIISEASVLAKFGVKEVIIISQDTSYYGIDLYGKQSIIVLLNELAQTGFFRWIRVLYWYPDHFILEFIKLIKRYPCIVPYLDLPVQHVTDRILRSMKRGNTENSLIQLFREIRNQLPEIALRTSFIVGYPGEKEEDFMRLIYFIKKIRFNHIGVFLYSDEEGTASFQLKGKVNRKVALRRKHKLLTVQQKISLKNNNKLINTYQPVLIDDYDSRTQCYSGRTYRDAPQIDNEVLISAKQFEPHLIGSFQEIKITDASEYELYAAWKAEL